MVATAEGVGHGRSPAWSRDRPGAGGTDPRLRELVPRDEGESFRSRPEQEDEAEALVVLRSGTHLRWETAWPVQLQARARLPVATGGQRLALLVHHVGPWFREDPHRS